MHCGISGTGILVLVYVAILVTVCLRSVKGKDVVSERKGQSKKCSFRYWKDKLL